MKQPKSILIGLSIASIVLLLGLVGIANAQLSATFNLSWFSFNNGGGLRQSANYTLEDALGQMIGDTAASANARISDGFVQADGTPAPTITPQANPPTPTPAPDTYENDNACDLAKEIAANGSLQSRTFHIQADTDWARFVPTAGTRYRVEVQIPADSLADVNLDLYHGCSATATLSWSETFAPGVRLDFEATDNTPIFLEMTNIHSATAGARVGYQLSVRNLQAPLVETGAAILVAGRLRLNDRLQPNIHAMSGAMYNLLKEAGYSDEKIFYLATDATLAGYDAPATLDNLRNAITTWASDKVGADKMLTLYLIDHGDRDRFYLDEVNGQRLVPEDLHQWLSQLEASLGGNVKINVLIEACYSGSFIEGSSISRPGRVIVTSTNVQNVAYASTNGALFSDHLFTALRQGQHIFGSYWEARAAVRRTYQLQQPWLDDDGNGLSNELDGPEAAKRFLFYTDNRSDLDLWPPFIVGVEQSTKLENNQATIRAEVRDNKAVSKVWAVVYPPSYRPPASSQELVPDLPTVDLVAQGGDFYTLTHANFTEKGDYRVVIYAADAAGLTARPSSVVVFTGSEVYLPVVQR